jgi:hypothetical protein
MKTTLQIDNQNESLRKLVREGYAKIAQAREAGLSDIVLKVKSDYIEAMLNFEDPLYKQIISLLPAGAKPADYITSLEVQARKS